ncbi:MAG: hypothetical protein GX829_01890 [Clostridium sp.]|nr:hypothetical protein [Clostridium sp.]
MKKLSGILILLSLVFVLVVACGQKESPIPMVTHSNRFFEIKYPEAWLLSEDDMDSVFVTNFRTPENNLEINIGISNLFGLISDKEQMDLFKNEIDNVDTEQDITLLESINIEIDGYEAVIAIYSLEDEKFQTVITVFEGHTMNIFMSSETNDFKEHQKIIDLMIESIDIVY